MGQAGVGADAVSQNDSGHLVRRFGFGEQRRQIIGHIVDATGGSSMVLDRRTRARRASSTASPPSNPHFIVGGVLQYVAVVVVFISWFSIIFTGKLPAGLANFQAMSLR